MTDEKKKKPRYEWQSNGGCERCDALDGHLCVRSPSRPHPKCDCRIIDRERESKNCDTSDLRYSVRHSGNIHHGGSPDPDEEFDLIFDYEILCWGNAEKIYGEVIISRTYEDLEQDFDSGDLIEDALVDALEKVEEIAVYECPPCSDHPHVA